MKLGGRLAGAACALFAPPLAVAMACGSDETARPTTPDASVVDAHDERPTTFDVVEPEPRMDLTDPTRWARIDGAPEACGERVAVDPVRAVPPLRFTPCASGRAGCTKVVATWNPYGGGYGLQSLGEESMLRIGGVMHVGWIRGELGRFDSNLREGAMVWQTAAGVHRFAIGVSPRSFGKDCSAWPVAGAPGVAVQLLDSDKLAGAVSWAAPGALGLTRLPSAVFDAASFGRVVLGAYGASGRGYFIVGNGAGIFDFGTKQAQLLPAPNVATSVTPMIVAGDGSLALVDDGTGVAYLAPDGTKTKLFATKPNHRVTIVRLDRAATPPTMVWSESEPSTEAEELWTATFSTTPSEVVPRRVAIVGSLGGLAADSGRALVTDTTTRARLVRLSDGAGWPLTPEPGDVITGIVGVTEEDVWLEIAAGDDPELAPAGNGMMRLRLDALGAPTLPSGL